MRFVIIGSGRVGVRTARVLREEGHEATLVERDGDLTRRARADGFTVVRGDGSREGVLEEAGIESADGLGALTDDLNVNFTACLIGRHHGCRTVMRIDEEHREEIYRKYATEVDDVVHPERLGAMAAKNALLGGSIRAIADVAGGLQLVELTVTESAPVKGYTMGELELPADARLLAFGKADDELGLPTPDESVAVGDRLVVLAEFPALEDVRRLLIGEMPTRAVAGGERR